MTFTESEQSDIKKLSDKHPLVKRLWDEYLKYQQDPSSEYYLEVVEMTKALAREMNSVRNPKKEKVGDKVVNVMDAPILLSEDKLFDRLKVLLTDSEKIFAGILKGKQDLEKNSDIEVKNSYKSKKLSKGEDLAI